MEPVVYLDTHVVIWLYTDGPSAQLGGESRRLIQTAGQIKISPAVRLELRLLHEIERIRAEPGPILDELSSRLGLSVCEAPFPAVVAAAESLTWTRDPFDRLIVAQAALAEAPLVTKDRVIGAKYAGAVW